MKQYSIKNPPALPASCPPLPAGQVYLGEGSSFKRLKGDFHGSVCSKGNSTWIPSACLGGDEPLWFYAAPEGSEIVKLNFGEPLGSWADKLPREYVDLAVKCYDPVYAGRPLSDPDLLFVDLFRWGSTPENWPFWNEVDESVLGRAPALPPIPNAAPSRVVVVSGSGGSGGHTPCLVPPSVASVAAAAPKEKPLTTAEQVRRIEKKLEEQEPSSHQFKNSSPTSMQLTLKHSERAGLWDSGLSLLETQARSAIRDGRPCPAFTSQQLADACGTSRQAVDKIVASALLKLRKRAKALKHELA